MKKTTLSELLKVAKSDPNTIDQGADYLVQELSGHPVESWSDNDGADATKAEMKRACISLVKELERHGRPPSKRVVEMMEWAVGLRKRGQGNPGKPVERDDAMEEEAGFQYRGHEGVYPPISVNELAKRIGVTRATIREWRKDPDYLRGIEEYIGEDTDMD